MNGQHSSKTISFLMELIFVLFFFTIASAISVFVIVNAKEKNEQAIGLPNAMFYGKNLIANQEEQDIAKYLEKDSFYLDAKGNPTEQENKYKVTIKRSEINGLENKEHCIMSLAQGDVKTELSFLLDKGEQE
ncbi:MAG: hypothetical protein RR441_02115 [Longicatena sp.]